MQSALWIAAAAAVVLIALQLASVFWIRRKFAALAKSVKRMSPDGKASKAEAMGTSADIAPLPADGDVSKAITRMEAMLKKHGVGLQSIYADVAYLTYLRKLEMQLGEAAPEQARYFGDQLENTLVKKYYWGRATVEKFPLIDLLAESTKIKGREVLCVGARSEDEINYFQGKGAKAVLGIDLFSDSNQILVMDMHAMKFEDDSFDIVYARHSFEHSKEPYVVASELLRVCRDGGTVIVEVPGNYKGGGDYTVFTGEQDLLRYFEQGVGEIKHLSMSSKEDNGKKMDILRMLISVRKDVLPIRPFPVFDEFQSLSDDAARKEYGESVNSDEAFTRINQRLITAAKEVPFPPTSAAGQRVVADLKRDGIAIAQLDDFLPEQALQELQERFQLMLKLFQLGHPDTGGKGKAVFLDTLRKGHKFRNNDLLSECLAGPEIASIAAHYMDMVPRFVGASVWHNRVVPAENARQFSQRWHRDYNDQLNMKIFIYLNDVDEGTGPLEYLKGTHRWGPFGKVGNVIGENGYRAYPEDDVMEGILSDAGEDARLLCTGKAGTMVFADTYGLHRGGYCSAKDRHMIMGTYSTDTNFHKPHFEVPLGYAGASDPFLRVVLGLDDALPASSVQQDRQPAVAGA